MNIERKLKTKSFNDSIQRAYNPKQGNPKAYLNLKGNKRTLLDALHTAIKDKINFQEL